MLARGADAIDFDRLKVDMIAAAETVLARYRTIVETPAEQARNEIAQGDGAMSLKIGDAAPEFTLPTDGNGSISLAGLRGKKVVIYFYPKDDTSGCTKEACGFRDAMPDFSKVAARVIGVSKDSVKSHDKFKTKYSLPFILASDENADTCEKYGVWAEKSMYGRKYMGIERTTFLIDEKGVIRGVWPKVKIDGHVDAVLAAAKAL